MIKLRCRPDIPNTLASKEVAKFKETLKKRVVEDGVRLRSKDFDSKYWRKDDVKRALYKMHRGKCCYCERKRDEKREPDVEHFRPKAKVSEAPEHPGYWWRAYEWDNYFFACKKCNQGHKMSSFPLIEESMRCFRDNEELDQENPVLINPEKENPEDYIGFEWHYAYGVLVKAIGLDDGKRGEETIRITGINLGKIPEERAELIHSLQEIVDTMKWALREDKPGTIQRTAKLIKFETQGERVFTGFRRAFFRGNGLAEFVSTD